MIDLRKYELIHFSINPTVQSEFVNALGYGTLIGAGKVRGGYTALTSKNAHGNVSRIEEIGKFYYKYLKDGVLLHHFGIDHFDHFVKVPIAELTKEHHTSTIAQFDDDGKELTPIIESVSFEDTFNVKIKNATHGLVKITDDNRLELDMYFGYDVEYGFSNVPTNLLCCDKYDEALLVGGEFYTAPVIEEDNV